MGYFLGIEVGADRTVAAVARLGSDTVETVDLGDGESVGSVLHLAQDGTLTVGDAARERAGDEPERVVAGFPGRIGDGDPLLLAGEPWAAEELTAWLVRWVVDRVAEHEGEPAAAVAVTHPASGAAERMQLLAAAVAEQELEVAFPEPANGEPAGAPELAAELRAAAEVTPATTESGPHPVAGDAIAALAVPAPDDPPGDAPDPPDGPADEDRTPGDAPPEPDGWDVPAPRRPEPTTAHLVAELVGFTGGMGATNTAGLLSGYTPPHGTPTAWSVRVPAVTTDDPVALPDQRSGSGRWGAVAAAPVGAPDDLGEPAHVPLRPHENPTVLVAGGGLAAALAVVGVLLLWPAPRITDSAAVRPVAAVPAAVEPSTEPAVSLTPTAEPTPTHRAPRPAPRPRRPAVPPPTASVPETTPAPTASVEPTNPTASEPPSEETEPTTTEEKKDD